MPPYFPPCPRLLIDAFPPSMATLYTGINRHRHLWCPLSLVRRLGWWSGDEGMQPWPEPTQCVLSHPVSYTRPCVLLKEQLIIVALGPVCTNASFHSFVHIEFIPCVSITFLPSGSIKTLWRWWYGRSEHNECHVNKVLPSVRCSLRCSSILHRTRWLAFPSGWFFIFLFFCFVY